ncbi:MAG TPA: histidine kinase [Puia sp.]|nr:histidine kinase [Puia sp.]
MRYRDNSSFINALLKSRPLQHLLFWMAVTLYLVGGFKNRSETFSQSLWHSLLYLPAHLFMVYILLYFLIPYYAIRRKFVWFFALLVPVFATAALYIRFVDTTIYDLRETIADPRIFLHAVFATFNICGIAVAIKLFKYWYLEREAKQQAEKANLKSQLALLKSQIHPHFLFNTLNNLYSLTLERSNEAPSVVLQLSELLRYMLYDCDVSHVALGKEIEIIDNYIELEKIRYGKRLDISVNYTGEMGNKMIAPLLLLPFLENSFKHGASEQIEQCWINLDLNVTDDWMTMKLINSRYPSAEAKSGIGLENVKRRLDLLYKDAYLLKIIPEEEIFTVSLSLKLDINPDQ